MNFGFWRVSYRFERALLHFMRFENLETQQQAQLTSNKKAQNINISETIF